MIEEITDEQAEQIEREQAEKDEREKKEKEEAEARKKKEEESKKEKKGPLDAFDKAKQTIDLGEIPEGNDQVKEENIGTRKLLEGFKFLNIKVHLLTDTLDKLYTKQKYNNLFDIATLSIASGIHMKDADFKKIMKKNAKVHVELSDQLVILKKDQRAEYRSKVETYGKECGWKPVDSFYKHHLLFDIGN